MKILKMYLARSILCLLSFRKLKRPLLSLLKKFPFIESLLLRFYYSKHKKATDNKCGKPDLDRDAMEIYAMLKDRIKNEENAI